MSGKKKKEYKDLYVLVLDGFILTPDTFLQYWKNYGSIGSNLQGWRPPKKIYYTLGYAKSGLKRVPKEIRDKVEIHKFVSTGKVEL
jgi:hypothetical protein